MSKLLTVAAPKNTPFLSSTGMLLIVLFNETENKEHLYEITGIEDDGTYILRFIV